LTAEEENEVVRHFVNREKERYRYSMMEKGLKPEQIDERLSLKNFELKLFLKNI
jgi:hypothetical protein